MTNKIKKMTSCEKAILACNKSQYKEASLWEKLKHSLHILYCRTCKKHSKNNKKLTELLESSNITYIDETEKKVMKDKLTKAMQETH